MASAAIDTQDERSMSGRGAGNSVDTSGPDNMAGRVGEPQAPHPNHKTRLVSSQSVAFDSVAAAAAAAIAADAGAGPSVPEAVAEGGAEEDDAHTEAKRGSSRRHKTDGGGAAAAASHLSQHEGKPGDPVVVRPKYTTVFLGKQRAVLRVEPRYAPQEVIGAGAYGIVCSAKDLKTRLPCAIKKIESTLDHRSLAKRTLRELIFLREFDHENIMGLHRVMLPTSYRFRDIYLVTELMETDLACVIRSPQELSDDHVQFFIYQVLRGAKYIHSAGVVHRDLKPRNLLVNSNCDLKICDFGLARYIDRSDQTSMSDYVATRWYRAPEVLLRTERYGTPIDMWAIGCILGELIGRKPMFPGDNSVHQVSLIRSLCGHPPRRETLRANLFTRYPHANPMALSLLERLLAFDPNERISCSEALRHPYLAELHDDGDEPVRECIDPREFSFETQHPTKEDLRKWIYYEIVNHNPVETWEPSPEQRQPQWLVPSTRRRRRRRKSF